MNLPSEQCTGDSSTPPTECSSLSDRSTATSSHTELDAAMSRIQGFFSVENEHGLELARQYSRRIREFSLGDSDGCSSSSESESESCAVDGSPPNHPMHRAVPAFSTTLREHESRHGSSVGALPMLKFGPGHRDGRASRDVDAKARCENIMGVTVSRDPPSTFDEVGSCSSQQWRWGLPWTGGRGKEGHLDYLCISERGRPQFRQFARSVRQQLSAECAECNPYVKALQAHREELAQSTMYLEDEVVDSLASRLATRRDGGLATIVVQKEDLADCTCRDIKGPADLSMGLRSRDEVARPDRDPVRQGALQGRAQPSAVHEVDM
eukprot:CAMPEP_0194483682 /NCGR_PEP_ID=MMETSP0253-20130528/5211_1 /TAXON_ID=2966 /ORGANISM="Noctiluca scintillans" /LENGTH=322 /DNA_ID=CAMNT_0039323361 /DNA_START=62 /DNA_END=1031 /DNA_ORIENTATION=-